MPTPLDEYPVHQTPLPMDRVATSDRNFYDRCYFNAHDRSGEIFMVTGLGVYPNLGVIDAYAAARPGDRQWSVRFSDALDQRTLEQQVGGYRIAGTLGRGGMGFVYEAEHAVLGRKAALKTLLPDFLEDGDFRERFIAESQMVAALDHPSIIPIYDAGESDGIVYIAMRYVAGGDLHQLLESGPLEPERALTILEQVAGALDAAHAKELVHRDVKPANVLVETGGRVYLTDFGIAKRARSRGLTRTGFFVGTLDYAAPEQIRGEPVGAPADIYAFGCLLFECLTGKKPFDRETDVAVMHAHLLDPPPAVSAARQSCQVCGDSGS